MLLATILGSLQFQPEIRQITPFADLVLGDDWCGARKAYAALLGSLNLYCEPSQQFSKLVLVDQKVDNGRQRGQHEHIIPHGQSPARSPLNGTVHPNIQTSISINGGLFLKCPADACEHLGHGHRPVILRRLPVCFPRNYFADNLGDADSLASRSAGWRGQRFTKLVAR